jgi:hypothetical protein
MWIAWEKRVTRTNYWWESLKERGNLEALDIYIYIWEETLKLILKSGIVGCELPLFGSG